ncbi:MAG: hypothetical protein JWR38_5556 [Mucilaginibacter sp.]|nr:hypothetical protein [Mucilaginibacter sp.]
MKIVVLPAILLFLCFPFISNASGYWLDIKGSGKLNDPVQIQVCYGYIDESSVRHRDNGPELALIGGFKISILDEKGQRIIIPIHQTQNCWEGTFLPKANGVYQILGINDTHPIVDRSKTGGKNIRPIDYLSTAYQVGTTSSVLKPVQFLDIITTPKSKQVIVKAFNHDAPAVTTTKLRVFNPENWEKELVVDDQGEATFMPTMKGLYIIREDWVDPTPGTYQGVTYTSIRHRCNYCLLVQ